MENWTIEIKEGTVTFRSDGVSAAVSVGPALVRRALEGLQDVGCPFETATELVRTMQRRLREVAPGRQLKACHSAMRHVATAMPLVLTVAPKVPRRIVRVMQDTLFQEFAIAELETKVAGNSVLRRLGILPPDADGDDLSPSELCASICEAAGYVMTCYEAAAAGEDVAGISGSEAVVMADAALEFCVMLLAEALFELMGPQVL